MSKDDNVMVKTRRALNCLQHSPNGKSIVGISPRKTTNRKKVVYDSSETNNLKRRTSISLPDICSYANAKDANNLNKSATSTPHKVKVNTTTTPIKFSKTNISIIIEEKENPNYCFAHSVVEKSELNNKKETREIAIQCNKSEEDMLFSDSVEDTNYWKLIALKRVKALLESKEENSQVRLKLIYPLIYFNLIIFKI